MARGVGKPFTSESGRKAQSSSIKKRKQNTEERKNAAAVAKEVLDRIITSKQGDKKSVREVLVETILSNAINAKDLRAIMALLDLAGEGIDKKASVDITTGGCALEPITGMVVLPPVGSVEKPSKARKTAKKKK